MRLSQQRACRRRQLNSFLVPFMSYSCISMWGAPLIFLWSSEWEEHNNLFSSSLIPLCVSFCTVVNRSGRHLMNPRGALPLSVSDESPSGWQEVITERKTLWYIYKKTSKRDKEDWCPSSGHTCENMPMTLSPLRCLSVLLPLLSIFTSFQIPVTPLPLPFFSCLFTPGACDNKSHLSFLCNPSIIACDHLKITLQEQRNRAECARAPMPVLLIVEEMNIPLQSDWEMEMERGLYRD